MNLVLAAIGGLAVITVAAESAAMILTGPVHDPDRLLSPDASAKVQNAALNFKNLTGRRMVVMIISSGRVPALSSAIGNKLDASVGIIYATGPDDAVGRLLIVDPVWRKAAPTQWGFMFPQRLAEKFGDEPFERRVVLSAHYLATVFPEKIDFVLKPRGGTLSPGSLRFSRGAYIGIEMLGYFIIFFTLFRTLWPARLRDEDTDEFSNELRRLKKERQIW